MQTAKPVNVWPLCKGIHSAAMIGPLSLSLQKKWTNHQGIFMWTSTCFTLGLPLIGATCTSLKLHLKHTLVDASTSNMLQPRAGENVQGPEIGGKKSGDCLVVV